MAAPVAANYAAGMHALWLHPKQVEVFKAPKRYKVVVAGRRWGKTFLSRTALVTQACKKKKALIWYVAPTYGMARDIMWSELIDALPPRIVKKKNETKLEVVLINGSVIQLKGADKPDTLRGRGVDYVVLDEYQDFKSGTWEEVIYPTLMDKRGGALIIGTPKAYNALYDVYMRGQDAQQRDWGSWQFPTISSPFIPEKEIEAAKANMDEKSFRQEFEASFETMSGRVYYPFQRDTHVQSLPPIDMSKPIFVGQDFNVDPMTSVIFQLWEDPSYPKNSPDRFVIHIKDEIYMASSNVVEVCDELDRRYWRHIKRDMLGMYPDPAGRSRSQGRGETNFQIMQQRGIKKIYARIKHPSREDRYNAVNLMLRSAEGRIRLFVDPKCKKTIMSLEQTIYKAGTNEVDKSQGAEHITDALGYPIEFLFPIRKIKLMGKSV